MYMFFSKFNLFVSLFGEETKTIISMKKLLFLFVLTTFSISSFCQKEGIGFGALPAVSFDSDLGFQYGALVNLYHYGDGSNFPRYDHSLYLEYSRFTKGSSISRLMYDSELLIPNVRTTADISYITDKMMDFYGFNGYQTVYDVNLSNSERYFYKNDRNMFRAKLDLQGNFGSSNFGWLAGYSFYHFEMDTVNTEQLNIAKNQESLYERYHAWGIIDDGEYKGGSINYAKIGVKYDSRDQRANPAKGVWTEIILQSAPGFINAMPHNKLALIHRQYFTLIKDLSFVYRIDYQMTLGGGKVPYYAQPLLINSYMTSATSQGLGGKNSLRGVLRNRVVGDAVGFGNFEIRYKFFRFELLNQQFYLGTNLFFDSGVIVTPIEMDLSNVSSTDRETYFSDYESGKFHSSAGLGLKIGWNENFVISADFGKAFNKQDGNSGFYVGLNYLF